MFDAFDRRIHYLRISVTDRCNLRCRYCMPEEGVPPLARGDVLSFEEIREVTQTAVAMGVDKVRLTGGEPLVRKDLAVLVRMLAEIPGIRDYAMTTNGVDLESAAVALRQAGLHRVNVSLDAVDPDRYAAVTRGGDVRRVLAGIRAAVEAGLTPVKLNCVVERSADEPDAQAVAAFARENGLAVRFIRRMDLAKGRFWPLTDGTGGHCARCNRLRLTSDGRILPCLFNDLSFDIRELGVAEALRRAVAGKPPSGTGSRVNQFCRIGG